MLSTLLLPRARGADRPLRVLSERISSGNHARSHAFSSSFNRQEIIPAVYLLNSRVQQIKVQDAPDDRCRYLPAGGSAERLSLDPASGAWCPPPGPPESE